VILFGIPDKKDAKASGAFADGGIVQKAARPSRINIPACC